ncbi:MAG: DNA-binding protein [Succinivibrionaceae bacterium]
MNGNITTQDVFKAVNELVADGERITLANVRAKIGRGSYATIKKFLIQQNISTARISANVGKDVVVSKVSDSLASVLKDTQSAILVATAKEECYKKQLSQKKIDDFILIAEMVIEEFIAEILENHLPVDNLLKVFNSDVKIRNIITTKETDTPSIVEPTGVDVIVHSMKDVLVDEICSYINKVIQNTYQVNSYAGGVNSLLAIQHMLLDLKQKFRKEIQYEQAYHY